MILLIWALAILLALYFYLREAHSKFSKRGINSTPVFPGLGHFAPVMFRKKHLNDVFMDLYTAFPNDRMVGMYQFTSGTIVVNDLDLAKRIGIKDFDHFTDRREFAGAKHDPLMNKILLNLKGEKWKTMRSALSPAFTSSKIRLMVPLMVEVGDLVLNNFKEKIKSSKNGYLDIESKDLARRYANDVIASCAFGLKVDSLEQDNDFYKHCKSLTISSFLMVVKVFILMGSQTITDLLKVRFTSKETEVFFSGVVLDSIKYREENNIVRNDVINLLILAKKGKLTSDVKFKDDDAGFATVEEANVNKNNDLNKIHWTDEDLIAQAVIFLLAGFETISTALAFILHELAIHPDIQDRLAQEIRQHHESGEEFSYSSVQKMKYMDMVVSEVLRLWPPATMLDRLCVKDFNAGKANPQSTHDTIIKKGELIQIPLWVFHRSPKYFPDPEKFDPERFSEENKHKINTMAYMPFGVGPRNCIGSRFALCEVKVMLYQLLLSMEVSVADKTTVKPRLTKDGFTMQLEGGHWVRLKERK